MAVPLLPDVAGGWLPRHDLRVRRFLATAPPWVATALWAIMSVALWTVAPDTDGHSSALIRFVSGCVTAAVGAPFMWLITRRQRRKADEVTGALTRSQREDVYRAATSGVPPTDPILHRAALDLARYQLERARRERTSMIAVVLVLLAVSVVFTVTDRSPYFVVMAVLLGASLIHTVAYPPRQRRRITRLQQASAATA